MHAQRSYTNIWKPLHREAALPGSSGGRTVYCDKLRSFELENPPPFLPAALYTATDARPAASAATALQTSAHLNNATIAIVPTQGKAVFPEYTLPSQGSMPRRLLAGL